MNMNSMEASQKDTLNQQDPHQEVYFSEQPLLDAEEKLLSIPEEEGQFEDCLNF